MRHASFRAVSPAGLIVDTVITEGDRIMINAHPSAPGASCPGCGFASTKVHSRYARRLLDLPPMVEPCICVSRFGGSDAAIESARDGSSASRYPPALHCGQLPAPRGWRRSSTTLALPWVGAQAPT